MIHGATIVGATAWWGMNAVIMDRVELSDESIVGALPVKEGEIIPCAVCSSAASPHHRTVSDEMIAWKSEGTRLTSRCLPT